MFTDYLYTFLISMIPVAELRASVIFGAAKGLEWYYVLPVSIVGNFLPVPFILLFIKRILVWMKGTERFSRFAVWLEERAAKKSKRVVGYAFLGHRRVDGRADRFSHRASHEAGAPRDLHGTSRRRGDNGSGVVRSGWIFVVFDAIINLPLDKHDLIEYSI